MLYHPVGVLHAFTLGRPGITPGILVSAESLGQVIVSSSKIRSISFNLQQQRQ